MHDKVLSRVILRDELRRQETVVGASPGVLAGAMALLCERLYRMIEHVDFVIDLERCALLIALSICDLQRRIRLELSAASQSVVHS